MNRAVAALRRRAGGAAGTGAAPGSPLLWLLPAIALQALLAALPGAAPAGAALDWPQALGALALIGGGGWTIRAAAAELAWNAAPACVDARPRALVTTGPYRISRHPMYAGATAVLLGCALALGSLAAAGVALAWAVAVDLRHARREDERLAAAFGPAWRAYASAVRRWL